MSLNVDQPALQWNGPANRQLGQPYNAVSAGGALSGPVVRNTLFYNFSYQLDRRAMDLRTLLNSSPAALAAAGIAPDSVAHLLAVTSRLGIPVTAHGSSGQDRQRDAASVLGSIDFSPITSSASQTFGAIVGATWRRDAPLAQTPTDIPASGGEAHDWTANVQLQHSAYIRDVLTETTAGVATIGRRSSPFVRLPGATVTVTSQADDELLGVTRIALGGNPLLPASGSTTDLSFLNQSSWFSRNNKHRIKATIELRRQLQSNDDRINRLGSFRYNSLADLASGTPAEFTRTLDGGPVRASETIFGLSLGDAYRPTPNLQIQYGARLDGNRFDEKPASNAALTGALKLDTDFVPGSISISPRVGFSWAYGSLPRVAAFDGAAAQHRGVVRGGVGVFQSVPQASLISSALVSSGANDPVQQIRCVGTAVPSPDWLRYTTDPAAIPRSCADGTDGGVFASTAPSLRFFSHEFRPARSVRGNLQWSGPVLSNHLHATVEGVLSENTQQRSVIDRNFDGIPKFSLADEGQRPIYVDVSGIVPATGAIALSGSRVAPAFSRLVQDVSDLRSETRQARVTLTPTAISSRTTWNVSYVYSSIREQLRGFSSTAGDPRSVEWARGDYDARHAISYNVAANLFDAVRLTWSGRMAAGTPFTPMIASDVNGDGYANDRAFIFRPDSVDDPSLAAGLRALLRDGPGVARRCLSSQLGMPVKRNSCEAGWTSTASMGLSLNSPRFHLPQRANVSLLIDNPLGGADLLLHGASRLHGWGTYASPDRTLYYVRGFDPATQRFRYSVNSRFGATTDLGAFGRPVTVTLAVRVDIGPARERQTLTQLLDRGRKNSETRATSALLKAAYGSGGIVNPLSQLLRDGDRIHLDGAQADSLAAMNVAFMAALDSIWSGFSERAAALPAEYDQSDVYTDYRRAREASVDHLILIAPRVTRLLTGEQTRQLSPTVARFLDPHYLAGIRAGTLGNSAAGPFGTAAWVTEGSTSTGIRTDVIRSRP
jgi:hypothetical protein